MATWPPPTVGAGKKGGIVQAGVVLAVSSNTTISDSSLSGNRVEAVGGQGPSAAAQYGGVVQAGVMLAQPKRTDRAR